MIAVFPTRSGLRERLQASGEVKKTKHTGETFIKIRLNALCMQMNVLLDKAVKPALRDRTCETLHSVFWTILSIRRENVLVVVAVISVVGRSIKHGC